VLRPFFGEILLRDITIADIRRYQDERSKKAGPYLLNAEMSVVQQILKEAGLSAEAGRVVPAQKKLNLTRDTFAGSWSSLIA
jgi:hypothetical protein